MHMYASMQVYKYANIQVWKYASMQVCNYAIIHILYKKLNKKKERGCPDPRQKQFNALGDYARFATFSSNWNVIKEKKNAATADI